MAAVFPVQYTVRPNEALKSFLSTRADSSAQTHREPVVFSHQQPFPADHDYPGQTEDCETFAKLCYLAILEAIRVSSADEVLSELLGAPPRTVATFDRWWSLERGKVGTEGDFDLRERVASLPVHVLRTVAGPRERSPRAEEAVGQLREQSRDSWRHLLGDAWRDLLGSDADDAVRRAGEAAVGLITPVGAWWDALIANRASNE